ncbi:unnamed protein product [Litomosoides sigmodontis]|uniref:Uncharacterized protein n=1 Tax=Litomosoides sigmodontis TaxID=42156 RepID=A0A3P6TZ52_LITSI|nr:unnamed protein product [Litomosoides sigmodontis]
MDAAGEVVAGICFQDGKKGAPEVLVSASEASVAQPLVHAGDAAWAITSSSWITYFRTLFMMSTEKCQS